MHILTILTSERYAMSKFVLSCVAFVFVLMSMGASSKAPDTALDKSERYRCSAYGLRGRELIMRMDNHALRYRVSLEVPLNQGYVVGNMVKVFVGGVYTDSLVLALDQKHRRLFVSIDLEMEEVPRDFPGVRWGTVGKAGGLVCRFKVD